MDAHCPVYEQHVQTEQYTDNQTQETAQRRNLIIRTPSLHVRLKGTHIEVSDGVLSQVYGLRHLGGVYLHKDIALTLNDAYDIAKVMPVHFIDARGVIVAMYQRVGSV